MQLVKSKRQQGFSLIELVIVVVIIGIIGAIAIPRMSRGAAGASDSALSADLSQLRNALDLYAAEHKGQYPSLTNLNADGTTTANALLNYSDAAGGVSLTKTGAYIYGPYLRNIPELPVGANAGSATFAATAGEDVGWVYVQGTGSLTAGTSGTEKDDAGKLYTEY